MTTNLLSTQNLSLYTIPLAFWISMIPHFYAFGRYDYLITRRSKTDSSPQPGSTPDWKFDNAQPKSFLTKLSSNPHPALTREVKGQLRRAEYASLNGHEGLGFFSAAVVAANISLIVVHANEGGAKYGDEVWYINQFSCGYLVARVLYTFSYIRGVGGPIRGLPFWSGIACATTLYVRAGNALRHLVK